MPEDCVAWEPNDIVTIWGIDVPVKLNGTFSYHVRARRAVVKEYISEKDAYMVQILEKSVYGSNIEIPSMEIKEGPCRAPSTERWDDPDTRGRYWSRIVGGVRAERAAETARMKEDTEFDHFKLIINRLFVDLPQDPIRRFVITPEYQTFKKVLEGGESPEDRKAFIGIVDGLLAELPREKVVEFVRTGDYEVYKNVVAGVK